MYYDSVQGMEKQQAGLGSGKKNQNTWHQKSLSAFVDINIVFYYRLMKSHDLTAKLQVHRKPSEKM